MIKEDQDGFLAFRPKSQLNKEFLIFVPFIPDKRICPWEAINRLIEYNDILIKTVSSKIDSSNTSMSLISAGANFLFLDPNSGYKIGSRFLTIVMKKKCVKWELTR
jgi:hypothetical protein